jgi:serine/threonine protein kinase
MSLRVGDRLGSYEIIGALGAGGMGEVYRAHDARLRRDVAIKVLADALASDSARLARFEREARTLAALNHPHIAHVYGFEQFEGRFLLVMELVPGEDLARRVARGALPLDEALSIATQTTEALAAAHAEGIVHRDLKPANIKVRADGVVKVLDFGIAKAVSLSATDTPVGGHAEPPDTPTHTAPDMTARGVIVGTAAYMAPEQAKGQPVDKRADIWAFGCVLYEMLVGRRAFDRADPSESLSAVLLADPDWDALPRETPIALERLLRRCLTKDRTRRLADISDARLELDEARSTDAKPPPTRRLTLASRLGWLAAGAALAAVAFVGSQTLRSRSSPPPTQLQRMTEAVGNEESPALSPDGKAVAYIAARDGKRQVFVRLLAGGAPLQLTRDDLDHEHPRWAPDSTSIVYFTPARTVGEPGTIWEVPALGGSPRRVMPAASGADVSRDGRRIAVFQYLNDRMALVTANRDGSARESVALLPESLYGYPRWSPDDRWIAYQRSDSLEFDKRLCIVASAGGEPRDIARADGMSGLTWLANGSGIIYSSSEGSTVLYPPTLNLRVVTVNGTGDRALTFGDVSHVEPDVQPSGVAATRIRANSDIWRIPVDSEPADNVRRAVRVTRQTGVAQVPSTSPDESEAVYLSDSGGHGNLWVASTDGSGARQITFETDSGVSIGVPMWSPTSNQIAFIVTKGGVARQWLVNSDGSDPRDFVGGVMASWSPDGKWLYYALRRKGVFEIEKIAAGGGSSVPVRADDAATPAVGADGTLYWTSPIRGVGGVWEWIIRKARPESGEAVTLVRVNGARVPWEFRAVQPILSPDQKWLAQPLVDGVTTNLWLIDTHDGSLRRVTDYGDRPIMIARRVSWSRDGSRIYAAVAETDADIVLFQNLVPD